MLTSLRRADSDELVALVHLAEALRQHLKLVGGVWLQHHQLVAALVTLCVHAGPLLDAHQPADGHGGWRRWSVEGGAAACEHRGAGVWMVEHWCVVG